MRDPASNPESSRQAPSRRRFLKGGAALGAALAAWVGHPSAGRAQPAPDDPSKVLGGPIRPYGERSRFEQTVREKFLLSKTDEVGSSHTPLDETLGIITPSALHYEVHRSGVPDIDPRKHRLLIHGMVDRPVILTVDEIKRLPSTSRILFLECQGNSMLGWRAPTAKSVQALHGATSCSEWTGVPLSLLLREAGVQQGATWLVAEGADASGNERSIPMAKAMDDVLVAYGQNGEAVRPENGYPLRLIVPGWTGNINVKWLRRIKVVNQPYLTRMDGVGQPTLMPDGKARQLQFIIEAKSVITSPSGGQQLPGPGLYEITGPGVVGPGPGPPGRGLDGWWQDLARCSPPGTGPAARPHSLPARLAMGRARGRSAVAMHRRDRLRAADAGRTGQGPRPELGLLQQRHPELEGGGRRERPQCACVDCRE